MHTRTDGTAARAPPETSLADTARRLKAIFIGSAGNLVEWFDFYAYSAFALYFATAFFPSESQTAQLLNAAGDLRRRLPHAPDRRLAVRALRRPPRPPAGADRVGAADVPRLADHRGDADLRQHRPCRAARPARRAARAGPEPRRRVRHQRHVPVARWRTPSTAASIRASST